ncbi:MAG: hypothetical protein EB018_01110 [Gammaproteobacteria bacterium]|nr:hypothetical protein [Gammaproteobacteria bacterium]
MSGDFLTGMAASSRERVAVARTEVPESELRARIHDLAAGPRLQPSTQGFDLIAEMKLRSPALGQLRSAAEDDLEQRVVRYAEAGAAAVSVLTEPSRFDGTLDHLQRASRALAAHGRVDSSRWWTCCRASCPASPRADSSMQTMPRGLLQSAMTLPSSAVP